MRGDHLWDLVGPRPSQHLVALGDARPRAFCPLARSLDVDHAGHEPRLVRAPVLSGRRAAANLSVTREVLGHLKGG
eukprot:scaffold77432_cov60-Phaeocystis_antarctica.AAC.1